MKWAKERDLLIAQTMAFVQSIAGSAKPSEIETRAEARVKLAPVEFTAAKFVSSDEFEKVERPVEVVPVMRRPLPRSEIREEIQGRVAAFRAHQQLFDRDRDAYFNSVLARLRASTPSQPKAQRGPIR